MNEEYKQVEPVYGTDKIHPELRKLYSRIGKNPFHLSLLSKEDKAIYDKYFNYYKKK